jgi:pimeloyl-ACP methyl ester carboxylesterase
VHRSANQLVYVHGLWLSGAESLVLRRRLEEEFGYETHAFRYPTVSGTMQETAARLHEFVARLQAQRLHFVGHSLGGLVIYRMLERFDRLPPGRVVFLGTPAVGSRAARGAARMHWISSMLGNTVADELLRERERRWSLGRELGIIAGTSAVGLGQFFAQFDEPCDGTVGLSETRLPGATDHVTLPVSHMGMLLSHDVARQVGNFLEDGSFRR